MALKLTAKQEAFVAAYLSGGRNASESYRTAYDCKRMSDQAIAVEASRLLQNPKIALRVERMVEAAAKRTEITVARVLEEYGKLGFANMRDYVVIQDDGSAYVDLSKVTREQAAAIQEIRIEEYTEGRGEDARPVKRTTFKLVDKRSALRDIGEHLGMFKRKVEMTGPDGGPIRSEGTVRHEVNLSGLNEDELEELDRLVRKAQDAASDA